MYMYTVDCELQVAHNRCRPALHSIFCHHLLLLDQTLCFLQALSVAEYSTLLELAVHEGIHSPPSMPDNCHLLCDQDAKLLVLQSDMHEIIL